MLISFAGNSQQTEPFNIYDHFLSTQFWLGIRTGVNLTQPYVADENAGFSPINYETDQLEKDYTNFTPVGYHIGLEMNLYHRGFSYAFQPTFKRSVYEYTSTYEWGDGSETNSFETTGEARQRLDLIELPLLVKYDIIQNGNIRPFAQLGGFYSIVASAQKDFKVSQVDNLAGSALESKVGQVSIGVRDAYQNFAGVLGGAGVNFDYFNIRTIVDVSYRMALTSVTRPNYVVNELASLGDVNDKLNLRDLNISVSMVFPFRYVDRQFMPY